MDTTPLDFPDDPHAGEPARDPGVWQQNIQPEIERLEIEAQT